VILWSSGHRWTAICLVAYIYLAVALRRQENASSDLAAGLIPLAVPELLRLPRDTVIRPPRRDRAHRLNSPAWRRHHQHRARQAHQRWNTYAETTPCINEPSCRIRKVLSFLLSNRGDGWNRL
jgi:hypothetical protein